MIGSLICAPRRSAAGIDICTDNPKRRVLAHGWLGLCAALAMLVLDGCSSSGVEQSPRYSGLSSAQLERFYAEQEKRFLSRGYLRTDDGADAQPNQEQIVENFLRIALYDEYTVKRGRFIKANREARLRRWEKPVRMKIHFGPSVSADERVLLTDQITRYVRRLQDLTGLTMGFVETDPNFDIIIFNQEERLSFPRIARQSGIGVSRAVADGVVNSPGTVFCAAFALLDRWPRAHQYHRSIILLKPEHPDLMMRSCIHEEFAQALGLTNDSPGARPSIFNDDEEFALLTTHDELLLRILYDGRLKTGMGSTQVRPIVRQIVSELFART